ncbi:response regulator transcription factor [Actinocrispum sp. NPDC049592]|uniref:response regulator transcription factor n=1 Tax=Actinocrispum sp. NPDC049592 TaxID=3154835 RepID=UPI003413FAC3
MTRVLLVDDHTVVRDGLRTVLRTDPTIEVVGECATGVEAVNTAARLRPDVILMDLRLPVMDGVTATRKIVAQGTGKVLVLTTYDTDGDILRAVEAGATGYLLKDVSRQDLIRAVHTAAKGETVLAPAVAARLTHRKPPLTSRETEILKCLAAGWSNPRIARELFITEATVKTHLLRIFDKLEVRNRTTAVTAAIARGILPSPGE